MKYLSIKTMRILIFALLIFGLAFIEITKGQSKTYSETKQLLLKMDRHSPNKQLKNIFEQADVRMPDLIQALDDSEKAVCINSQIIINYLAEPEGLKAIEDWKKRQTGEYFMPNMKLLSKNIYLYGNESNLVKLIDNNKYLFEAASFNQGDISIKLIGYNKKTKTALFEIIQGQIFTAGWHSVIKFEDNKWRLVSDNNIWVH